MWRQRRSGFARPGYGLSRIETELLDRFFLPCEQSQKLIRVIPPGC